MRTILTSITLLIVSILLVIGCELINKSIQEESSQNTEVKTLRSLPEQDFQEEYSMARAGKKDDETDKKDFQSESNNLAGN